MQVDVDQGDDGFRLFDVRKVTRPGDDVEYAVDEGLGVCRAVRGSADRATVLDLLQRLNAAEAA
ncbi:hypothetical protein [Streptomyces sp. NBC_00144]|uniref:hypothetical protein n=1 Tax=Streptomyces sp. NBC_00144 TaxID=2975665 RepID=UPI003862E820